MKNLFFLWIFILGLTCSYPAFAVKCYLCGDKTQSVIQCGKPSAGGAGTCHEICQDCLINQVGIELGAGHDLHEGLKCYGNDAKCKQKYEIEAVKAALHGTEALNNLNTSLKAQEACGADPTSGTKRKRLDFEETKVDPVQELQNKIQEAFNLECPGIATHPKDKNTGNQIPGILAPIEGCNAASCDVCNARFCYLCLKPEPDSQAAHAHARAHSDNYWEHRDGHTGLVPDRNQGQDYLEIEEYVVKETLTQAGGKKVQRDVRKQTPYTYTDRYHWEIVREKLEELFQSGKVQPDQKAVVGLERLLKEKKMWPFPVGKKPEEWTQEVSDYFTKEMKGVEQNPALKPAERTKKLDLLKRNQIALLQNEYIFQNRIAKHEKSDQRLKEVAQAYAETLKGVLLSLKAPVLASLDASRGQVGGGNAHLTPLLANDEDERIRNLVTELRRESPRFFALGGEAGRIYRITDPQGRVAPFILSDSFPNPMDHEHAMGACPPGSQPPSKEQLEALSRAMSPGGMYDRNALPGIAGTYVWSSSVGPNSPYGAFVLFGNYGNVGSVHRFNYYSVRCVRAAPAW